MAQLVYVERATCGVYRKSSLQKYLFLNGCEEILCLAKSTESSIWRSQFVHLDLRPLI